MPGGKRVYLTLDNCGDFADLMYTYHLAEFNAQAAAMAKGLATQVPLNVLRTFTAAQFELLVTGRSEVDLTLLRSKTSYEGGYSEAHPTIRLFWQMLEQFTNAERSLFLKFVWSRDRLPLHAADFSSNFKITRLHASPPNAALPMTHTCFFTIDLPEYTSLDHMSAKVRYAMENCTAIDTDNTPADFTLPAEPDDDEEEEGEDEDEGE